MSTIEVTPQKPKDYDGRRQDHAAAARQHHLQYRNPNEELYDRRGLKKADEEHLKLALSDDGGVTEDLFETLATELLSDASPNYTSMTPAQLTKEADAILKKFGNEDDERLFEPDALVYSTDVDQVLATDEYLDGLAEFVDYENLKQDFNYGYADEDDDYLKDYYDRPETQDRFYTPEDLGLKDRRSIGREMARRVQIDVAHNEDDTGDSDFNSAIGIQYKR